MGTTSTEDLLARLTRKNSATEVTAGQINPPEAANAHPPAPEPTTPAPEVKADTPAPEVKAEEPVEHKEKRTRKAAPVEAPTQPTAHRKLIGALLVNAIPTFQHRTFEDLLAEANKVLRQTELRDDKGVVQVYQDYRDVPFGRGASVLLACVMQVLQDSKRVENLVISDRHTPEAQIVMNTMLANSDVVVRGV